MKRIAEDRILIVTAIIGILVFTWIYPKLYVSPHINLDMSREQVYTRADSVLLSLGYDFKNIQSIVMLENNKEQYIYLQKRFNKKHADAIVEADSIPVFWWSCEYLFDKAQVDSTNIVIRSSSERNREDRNEGKIKVLLDLNGRVKYLNLRDCEKFYFENEKYKDINSRAEEIAKQVLEEDFQNWYFYQKNRYNRAGREEINFLWKRNKTVAGEEADLTIAFSEQRVVLVEKKFLIDSKYLNKLHASTNLDILSLLISILAVILFIIRLRLDLLDLKIGIVPAISVVLLWGIKFFTDIYYETFKLFSVISILGFFITSLFIGGGVWLLFSVGESLTREVWQEKLLSIDYLRTRIFTRDVSSSIVKGISLGFILVAIVSSLQYFIVMSGYSAIGFLPNLVVMFSHKIPWLYGISIIYQLFIYISMMFFFAVPFIKRYFRWPVLGYLILVVSVIFANKGFPSLDSVIINSILNLIVFVIFFIFMLRYDILTVFIGGAVLPVIFYAYAAIVSNSAYLQVNGIIMLSLPALLLLTALVFKRNKVDSAELKDFVPPYLHRIYERERQKRELEIARNVQLQFLPQKEPQINNVEISSFCLPAMETGGDYYDFLKLGSDKLGVAIGDVSGKGISASFYMTLTKGFLLSHAKISSSPKEVLTRINELFYENVPRGVFISMIYGIFDFSKSTLTIARAGHNPMIIFKKQKGVTEELKSQGIGLGLEKGKVFSETIEDIVIPLSQGDICFFYTDGLNEAENIKGEEFGEQRIHDIISNNIDKTADDILNIIKNDIDDFTSGREQHDDMTAVIVKIVQE